jgi:hypothetical protein
MAVAWVLAVNGWELHQIDITAFLRGRLEPGEEVYIKGFEAGR